MIMQTGWAEAMLDGQMSEQETALHLIAMADRGESAGELAELVRAIGDRMVPIEAPAGAIDVCGTGGDGAHSYNVSTAVAIVVAACGVPVAKHGNRAVSSRAGGADTLEALGLPIELPPEAQERLLRELGIAFLFARTHHPALARLAPIRRDLGRRTIFNLCGPLVNPARVRRQLLGVASPAYLPIFAETLAQLDCEGALLVSGAEGLDELSVSGPSHLEWVGARDWSGFGNRITPSHAGLEQFPADAMRGGDAHENARALRAVIAGGPGAYRAAVLLNSAGALIIAGAAGNWEEGSRMAAAAIDQGRALDLLNRWIARARALAA